jgi:hypothetical protein
MDRRSSRKGAKEQRRKEEKKDSSLPLRLCPLAPLRERFKEWRNT